jgi:uncharacterized membrane protein
VNPALGPFAIASVLLVVAGALKAVRPHDTAHALRALGLPGSETVVRAGGVVEVALGVAALVIADAVVVPALVALSYAVFSAFVLFALVRRLPISSCGCFGKVDTPPSTLHVGVAVGACIAALGMVFDASDAPLDVVSEQGLDGAVFAVLVAIGVLAGFAVLTLLPRTLSPPSAGT